MTPEVGKNEQIPIVKYAYWNEYGIGVPERPFMRSAFDVGLPLISKKAIEVGRAIAVPRVLTSTAVKAKLTSLGVFMEKMIIGRIGTAIEWAEPLAPYTVRKKGHPRPLVETGALVSAIASKVVPAASIDRSKQ